MAHQLLCDPIDRLLSGKMTSESRHREQLGRWVSAEIRQPIQAPAAALVETIVNRHGRAVAAVLFYGSCMRRPDPLADEEPVFDFYVVVDRYWDIYRNPLLALANWILPPNVFYLRSPWHGRMLRTKYAIVSTRQLHRHVGPLGFHPYFWARFSQPTRLAYVRDDEARTLVIDILRRSIETVVQHAMGLLPERFTSRTLWTTVYRETYRTELRAEGANRSTTVYESDPARFDAFAQEILVRHGVQVDSSTASPEFVQTPNRSLSGMTVAAWGMRRLVGKILSVLRLIKCAFTFEDGTEYILWKIERHSGVKAERSPWECRHPVLSVPAVAWRLYRQGAFR
jgi:hypothetical protein